MRAQEKSSEPNSAEEKTQESRREHAWSLSSPAPGMQAPHSRDPTIQGRPHFSFALEKKKKENHTSFIKREEKLKTGPGGTTLSSQLLGNLRARGL